MRRVLAWVAAVAAVAALGSGPLNAQTGRPGALLDLVPDPTSPSTLYASTSGGGVFRSDDTGRSWGTPSIVPGGDVFQLTAARSNGSAPVFLLAATAGGLFRSDDRGATWVRSDAGLAPPPPIAHVAASPTDSTVLYADANARLGRSLDEAHDWLPAGSGLPPILVTSVAAAVDPRIAYAAVKEGGQTRTPREGIYKTADGGATWVQTAFQPLLSPIHYASDLFVDPTSSDTVFALSSGCEGFFCLFLLTVRSDDGGATWRAATMLPSAADARGALYSVGLRSTDHGTVWRLLTAGGQGVLRVFASPGSSTIVGQVAGGALFSSTDSGATWLPIAPPGRACGADDGQLCLAGGRFRARVSFTTYEPFTRGEGRAFPLTADAGAFWFFSENNLELVVKVVSGEAVNGKWWVFVGALTDVEYDLEIVDTVLGGTWNRHNPAGTLMSVADTEAF